MNKCDKIYDSLGTERHPAELRAGILISAGDRLRWCFYPEISPGSLKLFFLTFLETYSAWGASTFHFFFFLKDMKTFLSGKNIWHLFWSHFSLEDKMKRKKKEKLPALLCLIHFITAVYICAACMKMLQIFALTRLSPWWMRIRCESLRPFFR